MGGSSSWPRGCRRASGAGAAARPTRSSRSCPTRRCCRSSASGSTRCRRWAALRDREPVSLLKLPFGIRGWLVSGYDESKAVLGAAGAFSQRLHPPRRQGGHHRGAEPRRPRLRRPARAHPPAQDAHPGVHRAPAAPPRARASTRSWRASSTRWRRSPPSRARSTWCRASRCRSPRWRSASCWACRTRTGPISSACPPPVSTSSAASRARSARSRSRSPTCSTWSSASARSPATACSACWCASTATTSPTASWRAWPTACSPAGWRPPRACWRSARSSCCRDPELRRT